MVGAFCSLLPHHAPTQRFQAPLACTPKYTRGLSKALGARVGLSSRWEHLRHHAAQHGSSQRRLSAVQAQKGGSRGTIENRELLVGDTLLLVVFAMYKQITALIFLPSFPGWLAPLHFSPDRFAEFLSFAATLCGTWVGAGLVVGAYRTDATADLNTALARTCRIWLASMPVCAAQLVLVTALEGRSLVGAEGFAEALPIAASGPGEPFVTAAGVLGLMAVWRAFYTSYLDFYNMRGAAGARLDRGQQVQAFVEALRAAMLLSIAGCVVLQFLGGVVGEEELEQLAAGLARALAVLGGGAF